MEDCFDYIIVGAGSAGCVLANKLSENEKNTVLLIEAGGKDTNLFIHMPSGYSQIVPKASNQNYGLKLNQKAIQLEESFIGQEVKDGEVHLPLMQ